jgi:hypothetical protein
MKSWLQPIDYSIEFQMLNLGSSASDIAPLIVLARGVSKKPDDAWGGEYKLWGDDFVSNWEWKIEPLESTELSEGTKVLITLFPDDNDADFWLQAAQGSLDAIWDNAEDEVYAQLL